MDQERKELYLNFIDENRVLIENNDWEIVYNKLIKKKDSDMVGGFTRLLLDLGFNPLLYMKEVPAHFLSRDKELKVFNLPNGITKINYHAFLKCISLEKISLPNTLEEIGEGAFEYCSSLESVKIPDAVTTVGDFAFHGCEKLEEITFSKNVKELGSGVFYSCRSLNTINYKGSKEDWMKMKIGTLNQRELYIADIKFKS